MTTDPERLAEIVDELRTIDTDAGDAALDEQQQARFDALVTERETVEARMAAEHERREARRAEIARLAAIPGHTERGTHDPLGEPNGIPTPARRNPWDLDAVTRSVYSESPQRGGAELRDRALGAVEHVRGIDDAARSSITRFIDGLDVEGDDEAARSARKIAAHIVATSSPEYTRAWSSAMRAAMRGGQDIGAMQTLQRAMSLTDAAGGYAVPLPVDPTLIHNSDGSTNPLRRIATTRTITTDALRTVSSTAASFSWDGEAGEVSDDSTTFANIDIPVHKAQGLIPFSIEISQDYPNFTQDIAALLAEGRDNLEATAFISGTGSSQPTGITTALDGTVYELAPATAETFALADVYKLVEELPERFSARASFIANKRIYQAIRRAGGTSNSDFWVSLGPDRPRELMGYPTYEASAMKGVIDAAATADNFVMVFGDFANYWIVDRVGFSMELVPHLFATGNNRPSGQRGFYAYWRVGADSVNDRGFRMLSIPTTA